MSTILFYVAMSEVTKVGIGGFSGSDTIQITVPGESDQINIPASWGPSSGMMLVIISLIISILLLFQSRLFPIFQRYLPMFFDKKKSVRHRNL